MTIRRISPTLPLGALLLWAGCEPAPAPAEPVQHREQQATGPLSSEPARTLLANVSTTTQQEQLALDHLVVAQLGPGEPMVAVMLSAGRERRYVSVFEVDPSVRAEEMPGYRFVLGVDFEYHGRWWMRPEAPTFGDLDGDGRDEVLITFNTVLADRSTQTAIVLTKRDGSWRALEHPTVLPVLTSSFDAIGFTGSIRQDDKLAVMNATSPKTAPLRLHGLHTDRHHDQPGRAITAMPRCADHVPSAGRGVRPRYGLEFGPSLRHFRASEPARIRLGADRRRRVYGAQVANAPQAHHSVLASSVVAPLRI